MSYFRKGKLILQAKDRRLAAERAANQPLNRYWREVKLKRSNALKDVEFMYRYYSRSETPRQAVEKNIEQLSIMVAFLRKQLLETMYFVRNLDKLAALRAANDTAAIQAFYDRTKSARKSGDVEEARAILARHDSELRYWKYVQALMQ